MAYNAAYYEQKRIDLTNRIVKKMENTITSLSKILNEFYDDKNNLVKELQETVKLQRENSAKEEKSVEEQVAQAVAAAKKKKQ